MAFPFCKETLFFVSVSDGPLAVTLTLPFVAFLFPAAARAARTRLNLGVMGLLK